MKLIIKPGVDLEYAFELLKRKVIETEKTFYANEHGLGAASAYGQLKGTVDAVITHCTEQETESDIPIEHHARPGINNDLENTLN